MIYLKLDIFTFDLRVIVLKMYYIVVKVMRKRNILPAIIIMNRYLS
jgi:hypothetical protein